MPFFGGVEAGGTKFICVVGTGPKDILVRERIPTTSPEETLGRVVQFFREQAVNQPLKAVGVGCFGPVDLDQGSPTYGYITSTPKPGWPYTDVAGTLQRALEIPVAFDTDVNASGFGEWAWGAAQGLDQFVYLTIGTGIGGGCLTGGTPLHGLVHPEMGHMRLPHNWQADPFPGGCPYHGDCFEGLASGPSMQKRWGAPAEQLPLDHPAWSIEVEHIAQALSTLVCVLSPQRLILGGGVMQNANLFPPIRMRLQELLNGYVQSPEIINRIDDFVVPPGLGNQSGVLGALAMAAQIGNKSDSIYN
jgi:fructokinase